MSTVANRPTVALPTVAPYRSTAWIAFGALMLRDLDVVTGSTVVGETVLLTAVRSEGLLPRVIDAAEAGGFTVHDVSIDEPTLETVFISLTGKDLRE